MTRPRLSTIVVSTLAAALVASCSGTAALRSPSASPAATTREPATVPGAWLVVGRARQPDLEVIDAATGGVFMPLPLGVPEARWGQFVEATILGDRTTVSRLDIAKGDDGTGIDLAGQWR